MARRKSSEHAVPLLFRTRRTGLFQVLRDQTSSPGRLSTAGHKAAPESARTERLPPAPPHPPPSPSSRTPAENRGSVGCPSHGGNDETRPVHHTPAGPEFRSGPAMTATEPLRIRGRSWRVGDTCSSSAGATQWQPRRETQPVERSYPCPRIELVSSAGSV